MVNWLHFIFFSFVSVWDYHKLFVIFSKKINKLFVMKRVSETVPSYRLWIGSIYVYFETRLVKYRLKTMIFPSLIYCLFEDFHAIMKCLKVGMLLLYFFLFWKIEVLKS